MELIVAQLGKALSKEVETIVTYELDPADDRTMRGYQRLQYRLKPR